MRHGRPHYTHHSVLFCSLKQQSQASSKQAFGEALALYSSSKYKAAPELSQIYSTHSNLTRVSGNRP